MNANDHGEIMTKIVVQVDPDLELIVPGFLNNRRKDVTSMKDALQRNDFKTIQVLGHRMKGDGGGYGFHTISEIGAVLEDASQRTDAQTILQQISALEEYLERLEVVYRA